MHQFRRSTEIAPSEVVRKIATAPSDRADAHIGLHFGKCRGMRSERARCLHGCFQTCNYRNVGNKQCIWPAHIDTAQFASETLWHRCTGRNARVGMLTGP